MTDSARWIDGDGECIRGRQIRASAIVRDDCHRKIARLSRCAGKGPRGAVKVMPGGMPEAV